MDNDVNNTTERKLGGKMAFKQKLKLHLKKGALHKDLAVKEGDKIPSSKLESAKKGASPLEMKRITFAENARKLKH